MELCWTKHLNQSFQCITRMKYCKSVKKIGYSRAERRTFSGKRGSLVIYFKIALLHKSQNIVDDKELDILL